MEASCIESKEAHAVEDVQVGRFNRSGQWKAWNWKAAYMEYQPVSGKQALLIIALTIILCAPGMLAVIFTVTGIWHVSDRQLSLFAPVNVIVAVGLLIWIYRKWISKIE
jgi:hypothetical protein